jgi:hypothetical protein
MSKRFLLSVLASTLLVSAAACSDDDPVVPAAERFTATLNGTSEVPAVTTTATGTAEVTFTTTGLQYTVNVANIANVTLAHIHGPAAVGVNAGVILNLAPNVTVTNGVLATGSATGTSTTSVSMDSLKTLIRAGLTYVNVHNTANPGGHIRGQLRVAN